jgi:GxxExxY protein
MTENEIVTIVVESAIEVHRTLGGPGLLEAVYEEALAFELESRGLTVHRQKAVPLVYKGKRLASDLRLDLLVDERIIVECKATVAYNRLFEALRSQAGPRDQLRRAPGEARHPPRRQRAARVTPLFLPFCASASPRLCVKIRHTTAPSRSESKDAPTGRPNKAAGADGAPSLAALGAAPRSTPAAVSHARTSST